MSERKIYKGEDGEYYSEKTITIQNKDGLWYNVPTVNSEGKILDPALVEDIYRNRDSMTDAVTGEDLQGFDSLENALEAAQERTEHLGTKVGEQMEFAFAEGGMVDDNLNVDPVSGNEVPTGAMAEEVRDDKDVKVSPGEFIVPADVTQFYGVKKLEQMIVKAKEELAEMEANGRMGGEPSDDLPLSDEELEVVDEDDEALAFAEGGTVPDQPQFDPSTYSYGGPPSTTGPGWTSGGTETRVYVNAAGERLPILFIDGKPQAQIPEGFVPDTTEGKKALNQPEKEDLGASVPSIAEVEEVQEKDYEVHRTERAPVSEWSEEDFDRWGDTVGIGKRLSTGVGGFAGAMLGGALGGPMGALVGKTAAQGYVSKLIEKDTQEKIDELNRRATDSSLPEDVRSRYSAMAQEATDSGNDSTGKGIVGSLLGGLLDKKTPKAPTPQQAPSSASSDGSATSTAPTTSLRPKMRPEGLGGGTASTSTSTSNDDFGRPGGDSRHKGGLIKQRSYKKGGLVK